MNSESSWRELISQELINFGESWSEIIEITLSKSELDDRFDAGYGIPEGKPFTAWTEKRVYFPTKYDGAVNVASVPRNPCNETTNHVGG